VDNVEAITVVSMQAVCDSLLLASQKLVEMFNLPTLEQKLEGR
jgi:hypothetical protein